MSNKTTKRALLSSVVALILCFAMLTGTTMAWFTDSVSNGINKIQSGNLDVVLEHKYFNEADYQSMTDYAPVEANTALFLNIDGQPILWEPGACADEYFKVTNNGSLALKYQFKVAFANATATPEGKTLADVLSIYAVYRDYPNKSDSPVEGYDQVALKDFVLESYLLPGESHEFQIGVEWKPSDVDNEYNVEGGLSINLGVNLVATQYTYEKDATGDQYDKDAEYPVISTPVTPWDGTADTSWYDSAATSFALNSAEQLAGLAELVNGGNTFAGKTITLSSDVDLGGVKTFTPIGNHNDDAIFSGIFDGNGHTVANLYQNGWDLGYEWGKYGSFGLFGEIKDATIKNVTIDGFEGAIEGGDIGGITGSASGTCVFENIKVQNSGYGTYNNGIGGIIGWSGAGHYTFKNIDIGSDVIFGGLWGSFDSSVGGIVGQGEPGATYIFEDVNVACQLDVYNDVTAAYKYYIYRMCGMLIGRLQETTTIDGTNYPDMSKYNISCKDVTVTYDEWADYHYCVVAGKTAWRHEPGYAYGGIPADHDHSTCAMHHNLLLPFDSLFGGDQYGVCGLTEYDGVTVIYNNDKQ